MQGVNENGVIGGWTGCFFVKAEPTGNNTDQTDVRLALSKRVFKASCSAMKQITYNK